MQSGFKIRNKSLTISAIAGAVFQNLLTDYVETVLVEANLDSKFLASAVSILSYGLFFLVSIFICQAISKVPWIRVHLFKEKIVEGKWFECIFTDPEMKQLFSYGIVNTFFDDNGEFVYKGYDYSLDGFMEVGEFETTCSSLKYDNYDDHAKLDYAYEFRHNNTIDHGYGSINFTVNRYGSNRHHGSFFNSDGTTYYFSAILITDKDILKDLKSGSQIRFHSAMTRLVNAYDADNVSLREKISAVYELNPDVFDSFCRKEDYERNVAKELRKVDFEDKVVLDIGAGTGRLSELVIKDAKHLICTDSSEKMLDHLRNREIFRENQSKIEYVHCDHMAIPTFLEHWKGKVDVITAGYTIGAYFNSGFITPAQTKSLLDAIIKIADSLLVDGGKLIIIESLGIEDERGTPQLLSHDAGLTAYYTALETRQFEKTVVETYFKFDNEQDAVQTISSFWGAEGVSRITQKGSSWYLKEQSGIFTKTFSKSDSGDSNE